jgi:hypothetical protein
MTVEKARDMLKILQLCNKNNNNEKLKLIINRSIFSWLKKKKKIIVHSTKIEAFYKKMFIQFVIKTTKL